MSQFLATTGPVLGPTSVSATAQILSLGVRIYSVYAEFSHRPMVLINESWTPLFAAVVAAPILKLWPAYLEASTPDAATASLTALMNLSRVKYCPSMNLNNGPGVCPLFTR